jgi:histone H3/H4
MAPTPSAAQQEEYLNRLRAQIQTQTIQEIMQKMTEKCFKVSGGTNMSFCKKLKLHQFDHIFSYLRVLQILFG